MSASDLPFRHDLLVRYHLEADKGVRAKGMADRNIDRVAAARDKYAPK